MLVQVTFKDTTHSQAIETHIREKAEKLTQFYQRITSCRIVVEALQKHKHQGKVYSANIELTVPGKLLVASHKKNEDIYVAIRDAFHAIERQLEKYVRRRRGDIKNHDYINRGQIAKIFTQDGYGFIRGIDGEEYYFGATNVAHPQFESLEIGDLVEFIALTANEGLQANRVTLAKHGLLKDDGIL